MREAINNNPVVQMSLLGILLVVVGLLFATRVMKQEEPAPEAESAASALTGTPGAAATGAPVPGATPAAPSAGAAPSAAPSTAAPVPSTGTVTPSALVPGPGLPREVISAWNHGDAIALLIVRGNGTDDKLVRGSAQSLSSEQGVSVFIARAKNVARYSRITQGVGVSRVPALVVVRPKSVTGAAPQAQVSYGFRSSQSVVQAVHDALYTGPDNRPYNPG